MSTQNWNRALLPMLCLVVAACADEEARKPDPPAASQRQQQVTGNIQPQAIQIDGPTLGADLYSTAGTPLNVGASADWVKDEAANAGASCLQADAIAACVQPGVTGAVGGKGHWNGVRIVDGIAGDDLDIFLTGGKENQTNTWNIGPGSVGSSKYDIVQAYLANNQTDLYFGMERRGNNGTTAFDFEFNQLAPQALAACPRDPQVPCRSIGDVLFTFEMQGSGGSGSATPHIFAWDGSTYVEGASSGIKSSINNSATTAGGPWGHVDSHGDWVLGVLDRFTFAEATAPISLLPGVNSCGGKAYVQVRTRSSSTASSDLKDTTKVFEFQFNSVSGVAALTPSCGESFGYSASGTDADGRAFVPSCSWTFSNGATSGLCAGAIAAAPGSYTGTVEISNPASPGCKVTLTTQPIVVHAPLSVVANLQATCSSSFGHDATVSGGSNPGGASFAWAFSGAGSTAPSSSTSKSGTVVVGTVGVPYTGTVLVTDPRADIVCTAQGSASAIPYAPLEVHLSLLGAGGTCPTLATSAVSYSAVVSGGNGSYSYAWQGAGCAGASCEIDPGDATYCRVQSLSLQVSDSSALCPPSTSETETYSKETIVLASDN